MHKLGRVVACASTPECGPRRGSDCQHVGVNNPAPCRLMHVWHAFTHELVWADRFTAVQLCMGRLREQCDVPARAV